MMENRYNDRATLSYPTHLLFETVLIFVRFVSPIFPTAYRSIFQPKGFSFNLTLFFYVEVVNQNRHNFLLLFL